MTDIAYGTAFMAWRFRTERHMLMCYFKRRLPVCLQLNDMLGFSLSSNSLRALLNIAL